MESNPCESFAVEIQIEVTTALEPLWPTDCATSA